MAWIVTRPARTVRVLRASGDRDVVSAAASSAWISSRAIDAGQMRLHVRAPPGTRLEQTQVYFAKVEEAVRRIVGNDQIDVMLDNIGLPYSGINVALSDSATVGPMDGEILIALKERHTPTAAHVAQLRRELPKLFPELHVLLSARRHRQPGPELRAAGPDRHPRVGTQQRGNLRRRLEAGRRSA